MSDRAYIKPYSVIVPAGFKEVQLPVEGNFLFVNESPVVLNIELKGGSDSGIIEFRRNQGLRNRKSSFRFLSISRSQNDASADADYVANITAGTLPEGMDFFT